METTLEVLTTRRGRRETHRHWPNEVKARIVSESLRPGVTVNEVADRYGIKANHLSSWRTLARKGMLLLPQPEDVVEFAALIVEPPAPIDAPEQPSTKSVSRAEIVVGPVTIRLEEGASAARIVAVARALAAAT
ncbi:transposase [Neorhizobium sp. 2083]|uniref:IS66-like element accessory protein TnpA n=1 Tax=Neorhizobium sp. 2083 TaxID=2817762 RepID=UPI0028550226|nr:transposase [Neorhizobium sp. 2083]MDR6821147.1 transposase [Neorhizobium sp. 2083]